MELTNTTTQEIKTALLKAWAEAGAKPRVSVSIGRGRYDSFEGILNVVIAFPPASAGGAPRPGIAAVNALISKTLPGVVLYQSAFASAAYRLRIGIKRVER